MAFSDTEVVSFVGGYVACMLWSSGDDGEFDSEDMDSFAPQVKEGIKHDCAQFIVYNEADIRDYIRIRKQSTAEGMSSAGHDFWLTRNGHGAGFWDRGVGLVGDKLTKAAQVYGVQDVYRGDDGLLYLSGLETFTQ